MTSTELVEFNGQVVVISGAATGIGKASAQLIASRGAKVIALDFNKAALDELAEELKLAPNQVHTCDISDQNQITAAISAILKDHGIIDALINTAGIVGPSNTPAIDVKWADFEKVLQVNLYGAIWLTQAVIPAMKAKKYGRIVHLASIAGKEGNPGLSPYNTSKAGMIGFVKGVAKEVAADGITINSLAPAVISTPMNANTSDETLKYMISRIPMGRVGQPEEVAEIVAFMASKACSFTTGFTFDASGGRATY
jgi:3-oxoacyl-[acyl-carrier protein] reductase